MQYLLTLILPKMGSLFYYSIDALHTDVDSKTENLQETISIPLYLLKPGSDFYEILIGPHLKQKNYSETVRTSSSKKEDSNENYFILV